MKFNSLTSVQKSRFSTQSREDKATSQDVRGMVTNHSSAGDIVNIRGERISAVSNKHDRIEMASQGVHPDSWSGSHPHHGIDMLIPSLISEDKVQVRKAEYTSTSELAQYLRSKGDTVTTYPFRHYRANIYTGQPRLLSNADILKGKEPIYGDLDNFKKIRDKLQDFQKKIFSLCEGSSSLVAKCEMEDAPKWCLQQWKYPGCYADSPITDAEVPAHLDDKALHSIDVVTRAYKTALPADYNTNDWRKLTLLDYDPDDTMTGAPCFASGEDTYLARLATLKAAPVPKCGAAEWYSKLLAQQDEIGWPDPCMYSPCLSFRYGPTNKWLRLWYGEDGYLESMFESLGGYNRDRKVYPAPYLINYILSALYKQLSEVRKNWLGLWHDPVSQEAYIKALQRQGGYPYSVDFSGMDTGMLEQIIMPIFMSLKKAGFAQWPLELMEVMYPHMGIIYPTLEGGVENISMITGPARPWCSGWKLTSEIDTIYGMAVFTDSVDRVYPGFQSRWANKSHVICELGDDIFTTFSKRMSFDDVQAEALKNWGAKLKVNEDLMFLKWMLPLNGEVKTKARTFSRAVQQTFMNEDRYTGVQGGDRPDSVLRMSLKARTIGLKENPLYDKLMPDFIDLIKMMPYVSSAPDSFISDVILGDKLALDQDVEEIFQYAKTAPSYFLAIQERAKYEPSAAQMLGLWQELNVPVDAAPALEIRKIFDKSLFSEPTPEDVHNLMEWTNNAIS